MSRRQMPAAQSEVISSVWSSQNFSWCFDFAVFFILLRRSGANNKRKWYIGSVVATVLLITVLGFIPFENLFYTFPSPESASLYYNGYLPDQIIKGIECDFLIKAEDESSNLISAFPKTSGGSKLGNGLAVKRIATTVINDVTVDVYRYKDTQDYLIALKDTGDGSVGVSDNRNSEFSLLVNQKYSYFAYINSYDDNYRLILNGQEHQIIDIFQR